MSKKLTVSIAATLITIVVAVPVMAGIGGSGQSGIQIQNLSTTESAAITVQLWNQNGADVITLADPTTIAKSSATNVYLPTAAGVPDGAYALLVSSDKPVAAIGRTDWSSTGGAAIYSSVDAGTDVIVPLITADFAGQTSQFTVQNTDTQNGITVDITLYGRGLSTPVKTLTGQSIAKGTSKTWSMDDSVWGTLPDTGMDMGASGFVGSVRVTSSTDIVVQSFIDIAGTPGVTGFSGVAADAASQTLYAPLIRANYYGDTGISIVNPNSSSVVATIVVRSDAGSPNSGTCTQTLSIGGNSSAVAFQGPGGNSRTDAGLPGGTQTAANPTPTNDGFYGVATITATGDVLAVVNDSLYGAGWAVKAQSTYNCATAAEAGTKFALPLVRRFHLSTTKLTTGMQIQNTSDQPATVSIELTNWDGTSQSASNPADIVIQAHGSGNHWQGNLTGLPTVPSSAGGYGRYGSAVVTSNQPVVIVVSDEGYGATAVDSANYNALKVQ